MQLHFIPTKKYKTVQIKVRFAAPLSAESAANRLLVAQMIETANSAYPTSQLFRKKLASLYGANFSTQVARMGQTHYLDINLSFVANQFLMAHDNLMEQMLDLLYISLFRPLDEGSGFERQTFRVEQQNILNYIDSELEDNFYHANLEINQLFYKDVNLKMPRLTRPELIRSVTPQSALTALTEMNNLDLIDIFVVGDCDQARVAQRLSEFPWPGRRLDLQLEYQQPLSKVVREKVERKKANQSILNLAYHLPVLYNDVNYPALVVLNGLLGAYPHSLLFSQVREKAGLAYTIGSYYDVYTGLLKVYAGIDKQQRQATLRLINQQWRHLKLGKFSQEALAQTKLMLCNNARLNQDRATAHIEQAYHQSKFGQRHLDFEAWLTAINQVTKADVQAVAQAIHLQAIYFLEGTV